MVRKLVPLIASLVVVLALTGAAQAKTSILYSLTATNVQVAKVKTGGYTVSLPAKAKVAWFTDRPARRAGNATASDLVAGWHANGFDTTPPNAAFVMTRDGATEQIIVVLKKAELQGTNVVFKAMQLPRGKMLGMQTTGTLKPGSYPRAELFIDDATIPPCGRNTMTTSPIDCTLSSGDGSLSFINRTIGFNDTTLAVTNVAPDAAPTSVAYDHFWTYYSFSPSCIGSCVAHNPESMTTPFSRTFGAIDIGNIDETFKITAPTTPGVVLHVTITQKETPLPVSGYIPTQNRP